VVDFDSGELEFLLDGSSGVPSSFDFCLVEPHDLLVVGVLFYSSLAFIFEEQFVSQLFSIELRISRGRNALSCLGLLIRVHHIH
jgi:hypothetical protein